MKSSHAVAVLITSPEGIPLVRDPKKPIPHYWKLPGGRSEGAETAEECAVREIYEELGLAIDKNELEMIEQQDKGNHTLTFFHIDLPNLESIKNVGNEEEEVKVFGSLTEIATMHDLFPNHRSIIERIVALQ